MIRLYEVSYPHAFTPFYRLVHPTIAPRVMDLPQRRHWREYKAITPLLDKCKVAAYLSARVPPGAYVRSMLRVLAMNDAPATLLVQWFDDGCSEDFPCY